MKQDVLHDGDHKQAVSHKKPRHLAEKLESYVGVGIVVVGAVLLAVLLFAFTQTGSATPAWMH